MTPRRLPILLVVLAAVLALRWWDPPPGTATGDVAQAVVREGNAARPPVPVAGLGQVAVTPSEPFAPPGADLSAGTRDAEQGEARNAFAVRAPPAPPPPAPPPPRPAPVAAVVVAPPVDPTPPAPPLQVIGTWRDERGASVFIAGPRGVLQARAGDTLLAEYQVTQVSAQQVLLKHLPSQRDITLAVPSSR